MSVVGIIISLGMQISIDFRGSYSAEVERPLEFSGRIPLIGGTRVITPGCFTMTIFPLKKGGTYFRRKLNEKTRFLGRSARVIFRLVRSPSSYIPFSDWSEHQHTSKRRSRRVENE